MSKVSIIVPVYNSEKYLKKCLDSLVSQALKDIEIILVNDGSTDNSLNIINNYLTDKRVKLFNKENGGQASARNLGLLKSTSDYIIFIDSDDYVSKDMGEKLYDFIYHNNYDIVITDYYIVSNDKKYIKIINTKCGRISNKEYLQTAVCPWNKIYKKDFLLANNFKFPEGIIYEDFASIPTLVKYNPKIGYLDKAFVNYVHSEASTMRTKEYKPKYEDIFKACHILYNSLINTEYKEELEYLFIYHMLYLGSLNFYQYEKYKQIDKIANFMKEKFPKWNKNKYLNKNTKKEKILMTLFYYKKYKLIKMIQKIKNINS